MYLSALTLKGFKSFASSTTLRFEPGLTCVVGPNGSGKSNVVDAVAWVLGEQGARTLRGGSMADVIFAGTPGRAPLGRAEVSITFDNSDGSIPEGAGEVTVTRTMFRSGGSEYAVNGRSCRLLDIQELLGDAGLGRELHVLVGQGRVDAVLSATPEERRLFLEEAAGVAKHRRRRDKALRKLAAMDGNLVRLADVTAEVARQLKPLGRQARTALRARGLAAAARDARLRLLADDVSAARAALAALVPDGVDLGERLATVERDLADAEKDRRRAADDLAAVAPAAAAWRAAAGRAGAAHERLRTVVRLCEDRLRLLEPETELGPDPAGAQAAAESAETEAGALRGDVERAQDEVRRAAAGRAEAEDALAEAERADADRARRRSRLREERTRREHTLAAARAGLEAAQAEGRRLAAALAEAVDREAAAQRGAPEPGGGRSSAAAVDPADVALVAANETVAAARDAVADAERRLRAAEAAERAAEQEEAGARARASALAALDVPGNAVAVVVEHVPQAVPLVQGLEVTPGLEAAVAAGLGEAAAALVVPALDAAVEAIAAVTAAAAASVTVVVPQATDPLSDPSGGPGAPDRLADAVRGHGAAAVWARHRLAGIVLVDDLRAAAEALQAHPPVRAAVTVAGEYVSPDTLRAGTGAGGDALRLRAELADAADRSSTVRACLESARSETDRQRARVEADRAALAQAEDRLTEASAACAVAAQHRAAAVARREAAAGEVSRLHHAVQEVGSRQAGLVAEVDRARAALAEAVARCAQAESEAMAGGSDTPSVLADRVVRTRDAEHEARVTSRGLEERWAAARRRAETAVAAAAAARELAALAEVEGRRRRQSRATAAAVRQAAAQAVVVAQRVREVAGAAEAAHQAEHEAVVARHSTAGRQVERLAGERARLIQLRHAEEIARTGRQLRLDALAATALEEYGYSVDDLVEQFGPDVPVPVGGQDQASDDDEQPAVTDAEPPLPEGPPGEDPGTATPRTEPFERDRQVRRLRAAERALTALGSINPLATEEYAALEERHRFLLQQQQDLSDSKRDLLAIIRDVDQKIDTVVAEAFADTARHFAGLVPRLFPGGTGRLVLTDPEDLVTSGIEVEARPAGKSVKRLSLLSGGERTLVALAFLVALFRARPSPFYVLDEIEAALDETNLRRLLVLVDELRSTSQLVLVTHQRPTMEAADALYGVTMTEGVSRVVGRRLRERAA